MSQPPVAIDALEHIERDALAVLSLSDEPWLSRTGWKEQVSAAGIVDERGRQISGEAFKAMVQRLAEKGASVPVGQGYIIAQSWIAPVLDDAHRRRRLDAISSGLAAALRFRSWHRGRIGLKADVRLALASGRPDELKRAEQTLTSHEVFQRVRSALLLDVLGLDVPAEWIARLSDHRRVEYLEAASERAFVEALPLGEGLRQAIVAWGHPELRARLATVRALEGRGDAARELVEPGASISTSPVTASGTSPTAIPYASFWLKGALAFVAFTEGDHRRARELFALAAIGSRKQRVELPSYLAVFDTLLAATSDDGAIVTELTTRLQKAARQLKPYPCAKFALEVLASFRATGRSNGDLRRLAEPTWIDALVTRLAQTWTGTGRDDRRAGAAAPHPYGHRFGHVEDHVDAAARFAAQARRGGYVWLASELDAIASDPKTSRSFAMLGQREAWELALEALKKAVATEAAERAAREPVREGEVWWTLVVFPGAVDVEAHLTTKRAPKGKKLSLAQLRSDDALPIDAHDRKVADAMIALSERGTYGFPTSILESLVGHPRVRDHGLRTLEIVAGEAKVFVETTKSGAIVRLMPSDFDDSGVAAAFDQSEGRITVVRRTPAISRALSVIGSEGIAVPRRGLGAMFEVLGSLAGHLPVDAQASLAKQTASADERIHVQLFRAGAGMRARLRVLPGSETGPSLRPGMPPEEIVVRSGDGLARVRRDLIAERARVDELLERCPTLASLPQEGDDRVARELVTCLELLMELGAAGDRIVVSWPEGQTLRAPAVRSASDVRVRVRGDASWLVIEGEVQVDEQRVLALRELLAASSRAVGRFVPIGDDEYIALTEEVRAKLEALGRAADLSKDGRVPGALLPAMEGVFDGLGVTFAKDIERRRTAIERANALDPKLPRDLQAELRDYQIEGFAFLVRRTEGGLGACLADDMGLGKTIQTIAVLLRRAARGPALVVAPTSVCRNWEEEVRRFAPSLETVRFASGDRAAIVAGARPGQIVIASYALLAAERELLSSRKWATLVFDEAHALKNASTHRWAAANVVDADAKIALTGTPVENHTGELHALFDLLAPGMLGSRTAFDRVFGAAIARGDRGAVSQLRQLVRPFVLRRTKGQVLSELPPKTELLRVVAPTAEHRAFYEAVRRRAVERMTSARGASGARAGQARIEMLAEITRLRRAAIDPRLVGGEEAPSGAKLDALVELVVELREEGRRALVFSQFLEVLDLAAERLKACSIECRRLDGTMSAEARAAEVAAFHHGQADVFLLSLKAGGVGMNLTAADFVILLDPWWNPAVEDQAADRAHRMGQSRPVTVARLVTEGTIEEKVLTLHAQKRKLYEDLVAGADGEGKLDIDTLVALLDEGESQRPADAGSKASKRAKASRSAAREPSVRDQLDAGE